MLQRKFRHGRAFAAMRAGARRWSPARRWLHIVAEPLVPWLLLFRVGRDVFRAGLHRQRFLLALPYTFMAVWAWSLGEWVGLWFYRPD